MSYGGGVCAIVFLTFCPFAYIVPLTQFRIFARKCTFSQSGSPISISCLTMPCISGLGPISTERYQTKYRGNLHSASDLGDTKKHNMITYWIAIYQVPTLANRCLYLSLCIYTFWYCQCIYFPSLSVCLQCKDPDTNIPTCSKSPFA